MKYLALLFLLVAPLPAFAEGKFAIGPQGGVTFPDFHVKNTTLADQYGNKNGWMAGVFLEFGLWTIVLRPEINYVTKGYTVGAVDVKNEYLEIPALVKLAPLSDVTFSPFLVLGPQWSKQVKSTVTIPGGVAAVSNTVDDWDVSGVAGLGLDINFSEHVALGLQGRYSYGFRDVDSSTTEVKTRAFYLLGGLSFQNPF